MSESYYKMIDGVKYDRGILEFCDKAVEGAGDGRTVPGPDGLERRREEAAGLLADAVQARTLQAKCTSNTEVG